MVSALIVIPKPAPEVICVDGDALFTARVAADGLDHHVASAVVCQGVGLLDDLGDQNLPVFEFGVRRNPEGVSVLIDAVRLADVEAIHDILVVSDAVAVDLHNEAMLLHVDGRGQVSNAIGDSPTLPVESLGLDVLGGTVARQLGRRERLPLVGVDRGLERSGVPGSLPVLHRLEVFEHKLLPRDEGCCHSLEPEARDVAAVRLPGDRAVRVKGLPIPHPPAFLVEAVLPRLPDCLVGVMGVREAAMRAVQRDHRRGFFVVW